MIKQVETPDFVKEADSIFPGIAVEYSALNRLSLCLFPEYKADGLERTALLQCEIAWQHYHAILLLLASGFGVQSLVLCRALFELVVGTLYLLKNPYLLPDFLDYGKLIFYRQALAAGLSENKLGPIKLECERIRDRFKKGRGIEPWHHSTIKKMAEAVCLGVFYENVYPEASAAAHSDATKTLSHGPRGWNHDLRQFVGQQEPDYVRYVAFQLIGHLFFRANKVLGMGHDEEANAMYLLVLQRAKSAAMPN
jgi:hypothetical protein